MDKSKDGRDWYAKYVCDDQAIKEALNGSFSIVNGFKDKPSAKIDVPKMIKEKGNGHFHVTTCVSHNHSISS